MFRVLVIAGTLIATLILCKIFKSRRKILLLISASLIVAAIVSPFVAQQHKPDYFQDFETIPVTVTATGEYNELAEGNEIWIAEVYVDGIRFAPEQIFTNGWIHEDGYVKWRAYDLPEEGISNTVTGNAPAGRNIFVTIQANIWRGIATLQIGDTEPQTIDAFKNEGGVASSQIVTYEENTSLHNIQTPIYASFISLVSVFILALIAILTCSYFYSKSMKRRKDKQIKNATQNNE